MVRRITRDDISPSGLSEVDVKDRHKGKQSVKTIK